MAQRSRADRRAVTAQDVLRICGQVDDAKVVAIVEAQPSYEELEEAAAWLADEGGPLREMERPLSGKAAIVYEILESDLGERRNREET
jgi:hypothetical protein